MAVRSPALLPWERHCRGGMAQVDLLGRVGIAISVPAILAFVGHRLRQPLLLAGLLER